MLDQAAILRDLVREKKKLEFSEIKNKKARVITISSGKGGVGKSNIVVNLAILLRQKGLKVLVFDADVGMGNDDVLLGIYPKHNIYDVVLNGMNITDVIEDGPEGIKLLSGGSAVNKIEEFSDEQRDKFLKSLAMLEDYDYILMDTGAGVSKTVLGLIAACDELFIVTTPEPTSLTDAYSLMKASKHFNLKTEGKIIINRSFSEKEARETYFKLKKVGEKFLNVKLDYLGFIFEDRKLVESVRQQIPVVINYPSSDTAKCLRKIANSICKTNDKESNGFDGFFKKLFYIFS